MYDKAKLIERYKEVLVKLNEPGQDVLLSAGGALVMMGLRDQTDDLDLDVTVNMFKLLSRTFEIVEGLPGVKIIKWADDVDLHELDPDLGRVCIEGVWCYSPRELINQKRHLSRAPGRYPHKVAQDLEDIRRLETIRTKHTFTSRIV